MTEDRLEQLAKRLGARAAEGLNVDATAQQVVERLREQPVRRTVWFHQTWVRIAAAVVLLAGGALIASRLTPGRPGVSPAHDVAHFVADDLSDLSTDELRAVLASFDEIVTDSLAVPESSSDLRELDAQQLRAVLRSLEG